MEPFVALIVPVKPPTEPPVTGEPPEVNNDLPLFPFVPIVVPPGGAWPGEPPSGSGERPNHDLPLFPFHPIVVPPGGTYPPTEPPTTEPPPVDPNAPHPEHPINLPPSEAGWWLMVYVPGIGWSWVAFSPGDLPENPLPAPKA